MTVNVLERQREIATMLIFGTALLSQIPAMRWVNRMDLAEATKVMT